MKILQITLAVLALALLPGCGDVTSSDRGPAVHAIGSIPVTMKYRYRSKVTGRFVTAAYARNHPETTTREIVRPRPPLSPGDKR